MYVQNGCIYLAETLKVKSGTEELIWGFSFCAKKLHSSQSKQLLYSTFKELNRSEHKYNPPKISINDEDDIQLISFQ